MKFVESKTSTFWDSVKLSKILIFLLISLTANIFIKDCYIFIMILRYKKIEKFDLFEINLFCYKTTPCFAVLQHLRNDKILFLLLFSGFFRLTPIDLFATNNYNWKKCMIYFNHFPFNPYLPWSHQFHQHSIATFRPIDLPCCQSYQTFFFIKQRFFSPFLLLSSPISKYRQYFLMLQTLQLTNKNLKIEEIKVW